MSTMNRPYFEPKWISGAQLYGPELSRKTNLLLKYFFSLRWK